MEGDLTIHSTTLPRSFEISLPSQLFFYVLGTLDFSSPDYDELYDLILRRLFTWLMNDDAY